MKHKYLLPIDWLKNFLVNENLLPSEVIVTPKEFDFDTDIKIESLAHYLDGKIIDSDDLNSLLDLFKKTQDKTYEISNAAYFGLAWFEVNRKNENITASNFVTEWQKLHTLNHEFNSIGNSIPQRLAAVEKIQRNRNMEFETYSRPIIQYAEIIANMVTSETIKLSDFVVSEVTLQQSIYNVPNNYFTLFDLIEPSQNLPIILLKNAGKTYVKVFRHISPPEEWLEDLYMIKVGILIYVKKYEVDLDLLDNKKLTKNFNKVFIYIDENKSVELNYNVQASEHNLKLMEDNIIRSLNGSVLGEKKQKSIKGQFSAGEIALDKTIILDLVFNDKMWSTFFISNEIEKAGLRKAKFTFIFQRGHPEYELLMSMNNDQGPVVIKISKAKNMKSVEYFRTMMSALLKYYVDNMERIANIYRKTIPTFQLSNIEDAKKTMITGHFSRPLRDRYPEIFLKNSWGRLCRQQPVIISEDQAKKLPETKVLQYPANSGTWLSCDQHHDYPYISMQKNTMVNKDEYPFTPCCLKRPNTAKVTLWKKQQKANDADKKPITYVQTSNKNYRRGPNAAAPPGGDASLPEKTEKFLFSLGLDETSAISRLGLPESQNSFLAAITRANKIKITDDTASGKYKTGIGKLKSELVKEPYWITKQEMYDYSFDEIKEYLKDEDMYFDPTKMVRLLEYKYDANIFLLKRTKNLANIDFAFPNAAYAHLHYKKSYDKPVIIVLLVPSDNKPYPYQCELLIDLKYQKSGLFRNKKFIKNMIDLYYSSQQIVILPNLKKYESQNFNWDGVVSQYIDDQGKVKMVNYKDEWGGVTVITPPLPPANVPIKLDIRLRLEKDVEKFVEMSGALIKEKSSEIWVVNLNGFLLRVAIGDKRERLQLPKSKSKLSIFRDNKRTASLLQEAVFYLFSIKNNGISEDKLHQPDKTWFKIVPNNNYDLQQKNIKFKQLVESRFLTDNLNDEQKLKVIVTSNTTIDKLLQSTKLLLKNELKIKLKYNTFEYIPNQYQSVTDFQQWPHSLIFHGLQSVEKWITDGEDSSRLNIINHLLPEKNNVYIFSHPDLFNGKIVLLQNSHNMEQATYISKNWHKNRINLGFYAVGSSTESDVYNLNDQTKNRKNGPYKILEFSQGSRFSYAAILQL